MSVDLAIQRRLEDPQRPFSLDVRFRSDRSRIVLYGPSGSGKSLTMRALAGLVTPSGGHIIVHGQTWFDAERGIRIPPPERRVGYLFQDYALFPHLTVGQNVAFGLQPGWRNPRRGRLPAAAQHWLEAFELDGLANRYPSQISGGQQQRVALARALAPDPHLLLLDEPFAAMDPLLRGRMREGLVALQAKIGVQMLVITHDPADVEVLGEHVLEIREGRIHADSEAGTTGAAALP
jgi:molybdate transport system ATP-binding protein